MTVQFGVHFLVHPERSKSRAQPNRCVEERRLAAVPLIDSPLLRPQRLMSNIGEESRIDAFNVVDSVLIILSRLEKPDNCMAWA